MDRLCSFADFWLCREVEHTAIVLWSVLANDELPRGKSTWGGQTVLQRRKGPERSLAPNLPTDRITYEPFHMEKGITKSLSLLVFSRGSCRRS